MGKAQQERARGMQGLARALQGRVRGMQGLVRGFHSRRGRFRNSHIARVVEDRGNRCLEGNFGRRSHCPVNPSRVKVVTAMGCVRGTAQSQTYHARVVRAQAICHEVHPIGFAGAKRGIRRIGRGRGRAYACVGDDDGSKMKTLVALMRCVSRILCADRDNYAKRSQIHENKR